MEIHNRKRIRLQNYDYNSPGYYFVTVCTKDKQKMLGEIVGTGLPDGPKIQLTGYGRIVKEQLEIMTDFYEEIRIEKFVIMPNHIHLLLQISGMWEPNDFREITNSKVSKFVGTLKRMCGRQCGINFWQRGSHDHVIRGEKDYQKIWQYIEENPTRWVNDCFYLD